MSERVCASFMGRSYCGRHGQSTSVDWGRVSCVDCQAAHRADLEDAREARRG